MGEGHLVDEGVREMEGEGRKNWLIGVWERVWERDVKDEGVGVGVECFVLDERLERVRYRGGGKSFTVCSEMVALLPDRMMRRGGREDREVEERDEDRGVEEGWEMCVSWQYSDQVVWR